MLGNRPSVVCLKHSDVFEAAEILMRHLRRDFTSKVINVIGVPRGGIPAVYILRSCSIAIEVVDDPAKADIIVDDLIDSGETANRYRKMYPDKPFAALFSKQQTPFGDAVYFGKLANPGEWLVFPWEGSEEKSADDIVTRLMQYIGEDSSREGLRETPARVLKAWREEWARGYKQDPKDVLKAFADGGEKYDEMILVRDIPVYTHCEHHLAPFFGVAHIGYIPDGRIVGLSKLSRLTDVFARRLQVQERLTAQIAEALMEGLQPKGVGVVLQCRHLCMESRGICKQGSTTTTSKLLGALYDKPEARAEFFSLIGRNHA